MNIERAIRILLEIEASNVEHERELAAGAFLSWINSSGDSYEADSGAFIVLNMIWAEKRSKGLEISLRTLEEFYDPARLVEILHNSVIGRPYNWQDHEFSNYNENDYVADIVRFMISYKPATNDRRMQASLGRAYDFINKHGGFDRPEGFERFYWPSPATHQQQWSNLKKISSFQFVRSWGDSLKWHLDPQSSEFLPELTRISKQRNLIFDFFGKVRWTQTRLIKVIDIRSLSVGDLIEISETIPEIPVRIPRFPKSGYEALKGYKRNRAE